MPITKPHNVTIYSQLVLSSLRKALVSNNITNDNYEGDVQRAGSVKIFTPDNVSVENYDGSDITFTEADGSDQKMSIDQADSFGITFNDIGQVQTNIDLPSTFMSNAGYRMADAYDQYIFGKYTGAASANQVDATSGSGELTWNEKNIYDLLVEAAENLDDQSVPNAGRYTVLRPKGFKFLRKSDDFTPASELGDQVKQSGAIGQVSGFNVYKSRNISTGSSYAYPLYGHSMAITAAEQLDEVETGRTEKNFKDFIKGLHVYDAKVVMPKALGYFKVDK